MRQRFYKRWLLGTMGALIGLCVTFVVVALFLANGKIDQLYMKFTSPRQHSLILGTSRASIGIMPDLFTGSDLDFEKPMYNYGFTFPVSPYGPAYLKAVKAKLDTNTKNGLFILEVNPGALSYDRTKGDKIESFRENGMLLDEMKTFNKKPNIEYLWNHYYDPYYKILINNLQRKTKHFTHEDGWIEITVPMDDFNIKRRQKSIIDQYSDYLENYYEVSEIRVEYLRKIIEYLSAHGTVLLVRLPVSAEMYEIETKFMPEFDGVIEDVARETGCKFFNFAKVSGKYQTYDGHHIYKSYAPPANEEIIAFIKEHCF